MDRRFTFFPTYYHACAKLPDSQRLAAFDALLSYGVTGEVPNIDDPIAKLIFELTQPSIDKSARRLETQRQNGSQGGRPKGKNPTKTQRQAKRNRGESEKGVTSEDEVEKEEGIETETGEIKKRRDAFCEFVGEDAELKAAFCEYERMRRALKKPLTDHARELVCKQLERDFKRSDWVAVLEQSVRNSWLGLFPLKDGSGRVQLAAERSHDLDDVL